MLCSRLWYAVDKTLAEQVFQRVLFLGRHLLHIRLVYFISNSLSVQHAPRIMSLFHKTWLKFYQLFNPPMDLYDTLSMLNINSTSILKRSISYVCVYIMSLSLSRFGFCSVFFCCHLYLTFFFFVFNKVCPPHNVAYDFNTY